VARPDSARPPCGYVAAVTVTSHGPAWGSGAPGSAAAGPPGPGPARHRPHGAGVAPPGPRRVESRSERHWRPGRRVPVWLPVPPGPAARAAAFGASAGLGRPAARALSGGLTVTRTRRNP
jgi:hypothetical protein